MAPSTWAELDRAPLTAQFPRLVAVSLESRSRPGRPALSDPSGECRVFGGGGFAALGALLRRVAAWGVFNCLCIRLLFERIDA